MKKVLFIALCAALPILGAEVATPAGAAGGAAAQPAASDLRAIVRKLEARYHSATTLRASFLERYTEGRTDVRIESGTVYFSRPGRMRWEYESPEEKLFIVDGRTVWFYVPADHAVTRARMKQSADWRTPLALLTGKAKLARLCGRIEFADPPTAPAGHALLRCLPRGGAPRARPKGSGDALEPADEDSFHEVLLEVDTARDDLLRVEVHQPGGVVMEYRFGNWQQDIPLPEAMFHFQAPAGVAIVDESTVRNPLR